MAPSNSHSAGAAPLIEAIDLGMDYGPVHALVGVNLCIEEGEWVAIVGSSGSGKSTLLSLLAALDRPTRGQIRFRGEDLLRHRNLEHFRRNEVGLVFQLHNLLPHLDARANIEVATFGTGRGAVARGAVADRLLSLVRLEEQADRKPPALSGGERQRVAIARALANDPSLILADEPTGSLDAEGVGNVLEVFDRLHRSEGRTIVMVTHDSDVAARADRTVRLEGGAILVQEPVQVGVAGRRPSKDLPVEGFPLGSATG